MCLKCRYGNKLDDALRQRKLRGLIFNIFPRCVQPKPVNCTVCAIDMAVGWTTDVTYVCTIGLEGG